MKPTADVIEQTKEAGPRRHRGSDLDGLAVKWGLGAYEPGFYYGRRSAIMSSWKNDMPADTAVDRSIHHFLYVLA